jgi:hypothetical protein
MADCRVCYLRSLTDSERSRAFGAKSNEPVTLCEQHQEEAEEQVRRTGHAVFSLVDDDTTRWEGEGGR